MKGGSLVRECRIYRVVVVGTILPTTTILKCSPEKGNLKFLSQDHQKHQAEYKPKNRSRKEEHFGHLQLEILILYAPWHSTNRTGSN